MMGSKRWLGGAWMGHWRINDLLMSQLAVAPHSSLVSSSHIQSDSLNLSRNFFRILSLLFCVAESADHRHWSQLW
jgi:hypothetical protein